VWRKPSRSPALKTLFVGKLAVKFEIAQKAKDRKGRRCDWFRLNADFDRVIEALLA